MVAYFAKIAITDFTKDILSAMVKQLKKIENILRN
jgi:hypothetical protein